MVDGYNQTYEAAETSEVAIDLIVGIFGALFSFVSIVALILLWKWLKKSGVRLG